MKSILDIQNQKIIVQSSYYPTPHLETELEIMEQLLAQGNTIYWLICKGDFMACYENPNHYNSVCKLCNSRVLNSYGFLKKTNPDSDRIIKINYSDFITVKDFQAIYQEVYVYQNIQDLKKIKYHSYDSGMATASSLVSSTRNHEPNLQEHQDYIQRGLFTGAYLYEVFQKIVHNIKPDLVVFFNGRFIENRPLLRVCQQNNIRYATHERGGKLNRFLFRMNSIPHSLETIAKEMETLWETAGKDKNEVGARFYLNRRKGVEDAWYSFTKEQQAGRLPKSLENAKKVVTIFNSSLDEYEGLEGFGPFFYKNDNEGIRQICESLEGNSDISLYLRVHPNLKGLNNSQNQFIKEQIAPYKHLEIIAAEDSVDTYALIERSDIVIVFGSTVGAEAAFLNKKVILLGRAAYEHLQCFAIPKNHQELMEMITNDAYTFPKINHEETLKYGYWNETFGYDYQRYEPLAISDGKYRGQVIKASKLWRKWNRYAQKWRKLLAKN